MSVIPVTGTWSRWVSGVSTSLVDAIPKYGLSRLRFRRIMTVFLHTVWFDRAVRSYFNGDISRRRWYVEGACRSAVFRPCGKIFAFTESRECCLPQSLRYILRLTSVRTWVLVPVRKRVSARPDCVCILRGHNQVESRVFICLYALILVPLTLS